MIYRKIMQFIILVLVVAFSVSCNSTLTQEQRNVKKLNEEQTFNVKNLASELQLAIEVEVTESGVKAIGTSIIRSPHKSSSALADLRVQTFAGDKIEREYVMPDPRIVEVEHGKVMTLPKAQTFIYAPLSPALSKVYVIPVEGREKFVSKGGVIDAKALAEQACKQRPKLKECQQILNIQDQ